MSPEDVQCGVCDVARIASVLQPLAFLHVYFLFICVSRAVKGKRVQTQSYEASACVLRLVKCFSQGGETFLCSCQCLEVF